MTTRQMHGRSLVCLAIICVCLWSFLPPALAQEDVPAPAAPAAEAEAPQEQADKPESGEEAGEPEKIPLNLKNVPIDQIVKFLSDNTGKVVVKSKDVQAEITIVSPKPVTKETAVELICQALRLEGVAVVERNGVISLVPVAKLAEMGVETILPAVGLPETGFVRKIIEIKFAEAGQIEQLITPLLGENGKLVADPRSDRIILTARAEEFSGLEKLIAQLDVLKIKETQVRIFQLRYAAAAELAPILQTILQDGGDGKPQGGAKPPSRPEAKSSSATSADKDDVVVIPYTAANWLVIRGPKEKLEAAEQLVAELDKEKPPELALNVILVKHTEARELAARLSDVFRRRPSTRDVRDTIEVTADERSNALIVYSTESNFELIKEIIAQLDTEEARRVETRSYELTYADAEDAAEQLNELYSGRQQGSSYDWLFGYSSRSRQRTTETRFVPERRTNTLIIIAEPSEFPQIEDLISKLDQPISKTEVSPRIYRIRHIDAKKLTDVLNELFGVEDTSRSGGYPWYYYRGRSDERTIGRLYGKVRFVHEPATNSIIVVTNNKENFPIIEELIAGMDMATAEYANTMVYTLENADAVDVADQINSLFAPPGAGRGEERDEEEDARTAYYSWLYGAPGRGGEEERPISNLIGQVRVVPDPRTNALLITTALQNFEVLRQLVRELDVESPKVLIEVRLVEVARTGESRIGTRWSSDSTIFESKDFNNGLLGFFGFTWEQVSTDTVLSADIDLALLIQFLQREFAATVLSQPTVVVNNNEEASIFVGSETPRLTESQREPGTTARNDSFEYFNVGTTLRIRPHINAKNKVVTSVYLKASQVREGEVLFGGQIFDTREYNTELAVEDGQTVVIGGILRQEESEIVHRVPILGHIPVLKLLFSKKDKVAATTELIAFITPTVLRTRAEDDASTQTAREGLELMSERRDESAGDE